VDKRKNFYGINVLSLKRFYGK